MRAKIAVMMDEDTSRGGTNYEVSKDCFRAIFCAGGVPLGIPYLPDIVASVVEEFDGFFSVGGGIAFPDEWFLSGETSSYPQSERFAVELAIMKGFLARDKPVFGSCHGMQMLAGLMGCKLRGSVNEGVHMTAHKVELVPHAQIASITGVSELCVNSRHREVVAQLGTAVVAGAKAPDGTIEEIEVIGKTFAIGCQWHQENFCHEEHPGNALFRAFVTCACR